MLAQIEGLKNGTIKPEVAKATAVCGMVICKTVELDLRAAELAKKGIDMASIVYTQEDEPIQVAVPASAVRVVHREDFTPPQASVMPVAAHDAETPVLDEEIYERIMKGHKNGLSPSTIARRVKLDVVDVELAIASAA